MSSDQSKQVTISIQSVSKAYDLPTDDPRHVTMAEATLEWLSHPWKKPEKQRVLALNEVSFDAYEGEVVGLIGTNGSGKSTLLKIISRITAPTSGRVNLYGRVGSLLEIGAGFHPELTGRENIYLNGALLGMGRKQITSRLDAIVEFAGVHKFLAMPVKHYSSGMYVRLAFAVAAHLDSEILVVDEVLAVGDLEFQNQALGKIREAAALGKTVFFVSHQAENIEAICNRVVMLADGQIAYIRSLDAPASCQTEHKTANGADTKWLRSLAQSA